MSSLFDYKREMTALRFTPEQKAQLAQAAAAAAGKQIHKRRRPVLRAAALAAAMAVALVVGSSAAGILPAPADVFAPIFGGTVAQTEVINKIGHPIGASATGNGITITADAIIGDKYNACIIYTVTRDDGTPFAFEPIVYPNGHNDLGILPLSFEEGWIDIHDTMGGSHGIFACIDDTPGDNQFQHMQQISSDVPLNTGAATATFKNLYTWDENGQLIPVAEGTWKLRFDMKYEDSAVYLGNGETFSQEGLNFTIDEISVSPIGVRVAYTVDKAAAWSDTPSGLVSEEDAHDSARYMENIEILLTRTDGTVIDLSGAGGSVAADVHSDTSRCSKGMILEEATALEEMASISVGGVVYEIPHNG